MMPRLTILILTSLMPQAFASSFLDDFFENSAPSSRVAPTKKSQKKGTEGRSAPRITSPSPIRSSAPSETPTLPISGTDKLSESTEAIACAGKCGDKPPLASQPIMKIDPVHVAGASQARSPALFGNECIRRAILNSAKNVVKRKYGNRPFSGGLCAAGVSAILADSGAVKNGVWGDAVTWHTMGRLKALGFKNIMSQGINAGNAPPGAVLVFRGPATDMRSPSGGLPRKISQRRGQGAGTWVGHVTVKGDIPGRYYTDGRTEDPAVAGRTLVGVYVPVTCVKCGRAAAKCEAKK